MMFYLFMAWLTGFFVHLALTAALMFRFPSEVHKNTWHLTPSTLMLQSMIWPVLMMFNLIKLFFR